jgi:hypothetical protein
MNIETLQKQLIEDFRLEGLQDDDKEEMLFEAAKTIQKQFFLDLYDVLGEKNFDALQASAQMGEQFYITTLKHLLPNYLEVFQAAKEKVVKNFKDGGE